MFVRQTKISKKIALKSSASRKLLNLIFLLKWKNNIGGKFLQICLGLRILKILYWTSIKILSPKIFWTHNFCQNVGLLQNFF